MLGLAEGAILGAGGGVMEGLAEGAMLGAGGGAMDGLAEGAALGGHAGLVCANSCRDSCRGRNSYLSSSGNAVESAGRGASFNRPPHMGQKIPATLCPQWGQIFSFSRLENSGFSVTVESAGFRAADFMLSQMGQEGLIALS